MYKYAEGFKDDEIYDDKASSNSGDENDLAIKIDENEEIFVDGGENQDLGFIDENNNDSRYYDWYKNDENDLNYDWNKFQ